MVMKLPKRLRNRLISAGLEPVLRNTEKSFTALHHRLLSTNIKIKIIKAIPYIPVICTYVA